MSSRGDTPRARRERNDGIPTPANPNYALATPGAAPIGVPNFFIDKFRIPPFLLPIYQAAGIEYGVRWEVLAAINEIETDYGRNLNVSSAGALGWMQFMPPTWKAYGVDANQDGVKDPYNPVDAIFAAARYLNAAGADTDIRKAVFAYNHADWYVDSVLMRARLIGGLPSNFVGSLTGLTQGRFPVYAKSTYAGQVSREARHEAQDEGHRQHGFPSSCATRSRRGIEIFARRGAPVVAVNDGRIVRRVRPRASASYVQLQDDYGNTYTYGRLGRVAKTYPAPKPSKTSRGEDHPRLRARAAAPRRQANRARLRDAAAPRAAEPARPRRSRRTKRRAVTTQAAKKTSPAQGRSGQAAPVRQPSRPGGPGARPSSRGPVPPGPSPPRSASTPRTS